MIEVMEFLWCFSPVVLIPLVIWALSKKKKLDKFTYQLYSEKRIDLIEYTNKKTENAAQKERARYAYYGAPAPQQAPPPIIGDFVGPPLPPELLQKRREMALAQMQAQNAPQSAVKTVTAAISSANAALPVQDNTPVVETAQSDVRPATETVQPELAQPDVQPVIETAQPEPAHTGMTQPPAGIFAQFIGPPLPPELIAERRAMSLAMKQAAQPAASAAPAIHAAPAVPAASEPGSFPGAAPTPAFAPVPPKKKHTINPASAMLVIGSALVMIAGMIFSTANWNNMSDWQRTGVIAVMAAFFFGVSAFAHKKLKLENTGMAFYMLGSVFTSITFVTVGYFGLFGNWLSVNGKGFWLLYSLAALLVTLFSAGAVKLYNKGAFVHAVLYGGLCSFTLMSLQLFGDRPDVWALFLNIVAAVPLYLLYKQKLRVGSELYDSQMKLFTAVLTVIYAVAALPFMVANINCEWTAACFLTMLVWIAETIVYGILLDSSKLRRLHAFLTIVTAAELAGSAGKLLGSENTLLIFGVLAFICAAVYRYVRPIRTTFSDIIFPVFMFLGLFTVGAGDHENGHLAIYMALYLAVFAIQAVSKEKSSVSRGFTVLLPFASLAAAYSVPDLLDHVTELIDVELIFVYSCIVFALALIFTFVNPIRTILSDAVFPVMLLFCYGNAAGRMIGETETIMSFGIAVMLLVSVLIHACEDSAKRMVKPYSYSLPFALAVFAQSVGGLANEFIGTEEALVAFAFGCTVFVGAAAMRYIPRIRTRVSDYANAAILGIAAVACRSFVRDIDGQWFAAGLIAMLTILIGMQCFDRSEKNDTRLFAFAMPLSSIWLAAQISTGVSCSVYGGAAFREEKEMLFGLVFMVICFAAAFAFMHIERIKTVVSSIAFPITLMSIGIDLFTSGSWNAALLGAVSFLLMAVLMLIENSGSGLTAKAQRFFLAVPFIGIAVCCALAIKKGSDIGGDGVFFLWAGLFAVLFGLGFRFAGHIGANVRTIVSDIAFTGLGCVYACLAFGENPFYAMCVLPALSLLVIAHIYETKPKHRVFVLISRWLLPCVLTFMCYSVALTVKHETDGVNIFYATEGTLVHNLVFIVMMFAVSMVFLKIRRIRTVFSDFLLPVAYFVLLLGETGGIRQDLLLASVIGMLILCAVLLIYGLEKDGEPHLIVHRFIAPLAFAFAAGDFGSLLASTDDFSYDLGQYISVLSGALLAGGVAAAFTYLANKDSEKRFVHLQYSWTAVSGLMLCGMTVFSNDASRAVFALDIAGVLLAAAVYILCGKQKRGVLGLLPAAAMLMSIKEAAYQLSFAAGSGLAGSEYGVYTAAVAGAVFALLCAVSRYVGREKLLIHGSDRTLIDFAAFAMAVIPFVTAASSDDTISADWCRFLAVAEFAVFFLNLIRKGHKRQTNLTVLTLAAAAGCALIYVRPFMRPEDKMLAAKINLIPLLMFSVLVKIIWKERTKLAGDLSFVAQLAAFIVLMFDALTNQSLANTIIVLCVTLTIMLVSFAVRSGRWFAISAASFLGLTIYITRGFVGRVEWWVYLLTAGLILIAVASVNEYMKSRGQTLKDAGKHFLSRWKKK